MPDRLEALLTHFSVRAHLLHAGPLCGINDVPMEREPGQLHLIKRGPLGKCGIRVAHRRS